MTSLYGEDNVAFVKVDGNRIYEIGNKYDVHSFPTFIYLTPNTKGMKAIQFKGNRSYDSMRKWMVKLLKNVPKINQE